MTLSELRPISARALKSAIDTLRPQLLSASVLDLYSGQGRFGIEALKEGAASVTFVERDPKLAERIKVATQGYHSQVEPWDVFEFLANACQRSLRYDIVFTDPPFSLWSTAFSLTLLKQVSQVLQPAAIFLVKHPKRVIFSPAIQGFSLIKSKVFGESELHYLSYGKRQD